MKILGRIGIRKVGHNATRTRYLIAKAVQSQWWLLKLTPIRVTVLSPQNI